MMGQSQRSILLAKALMVGAASFVSLGLGLGWATPALGEEDAIDSDELYLNEVESPATTVADWMAQIEASQVQITGVRVEPTETGLSVVLETAEGELSAPTTQTVGNAVIAEIPNAVLALPDGEAFEQFNPAPGIEQVRVTSLPGERVQVSITGTEAPPTAQVRTEAGNLVLSVMPGMVQEEVEEVEEIELIVTATRTAEEEEDIPRSVTVVTREQIEEQSQLNTNLGNILTQTVPGFSPTSFNVNTFQRLRGRNPQILIDGVPVTSNFRSGTTEISGIAPSAIERIEVVRGPTAVFGEGATGGTINIITRTPSEDELISTAEVRVNSRGDLVAESFGNYLEYGLSGNSGAVDFLFNFSTEEYGYVFDGEGDRVPNDDSFIDNARSINVLGKLGVNINENQRLQFSVNHLDVGGELEFVPEADDPDAEKARAEPFDFAECINAECNIDRQTTTLSLNYSHADIFGSQLRLQGFYRSYSRVAPPPFEDTFSGDFPGSTLGTFFLVEAETERSGGRLEIETPFSETFNLLWGADYNRDEGVQPYIVLEEELTPSGEQVLRATGEVINYTPPYTVESLGLFAQAQWDVTPRWLLSGGVRYDNISASVDDYTAIVFQSDGPIDVEGGSINADDVVFNLGTVYDLTDELNIFASFAQGFGVPQLADVLRFPPDGFRSFEDDLGFTTPQKVDNYELGVRGDWQAVQFSLAGFFNQSDLGTSFVLGDDGFSEIVRAPQRIYGIEATVDWQPSETWQLGSTISWSEGESDVDDDGDFEPLRSIEISPIKITAYVENETLPGWRNRFQALFVGGRDRAFEAGIDRTEIDSYFVLDYISSIDIGLGSLQISVQNLLDTQYLPLVAQWRGGFRAPNRLAAPGRTISIGYRVTF